MGSMRQARYSDIVAAVGAAAPAEPLRPERGFELHWSIRETAFGMALAAASPFGLCAFEFLGEDAASQVTRREALMQNLAARWSDARLVADDDSAASAATSAAKAAALLAAAFKAVSSGRPSAGQCDALPLHLRGTAFQIAVWRKLLTIPSGRLATYGELAASIGAPKASRAVGSAVGANPIAIFVPCHRVVAASGALGGYRWGAKLKDALINRERR